MCSTFLSSVSLIRTVLGCDIRQNKQKPTLHSGHLNFVGGSCFQQNTHGTEFSYIPWPMFVASYVKSFLICWWIGLVFIVWWYGVEASFSPLVLGFSPVSIWRVSVIILNHRKHEKQNCWECTVQKIEKWLLSPSQFCLVMVSECHVVGSAHIAHVSITVLYTRTSCTALPCWSQK